MWIRPRDCSKGGITEKIDHSPGALPVGCNPQGDISRPAIFPLLTSKSITGYEDGAIVATAFAFSNPYHGWKKDTSNATAST